MKIGDKVLTNTSDKWDKLTGEITHIGDRVFWVKFPDNNKPYFFLEEEIINVFQEGCK